MNPSRRTFLRAAGLSLALPHLPTLHRGVASAAAVASTPRRMVYLYIPNGVNLEHWRAKPDGDRYTLGRSCEPLADHRDQLTFIRGLSHKNGTSGGDGAGDHARAGATFLTSARPRKTSGTDIHLGVSADQVVAQSIGDQTRLPSLELSCDDVRRSGNCDSGYACAYQFNMSWADEQTPVAAEANPRLVFERLFGAGDHGERRRNYAERQSRQRSMLDFLRDEVRRVERSVGREDRDKLGEYVTAVRDIESRIQKTERYGLPVDPDAPTPPGTPEKYSEHIRMMMDVMALALRTDTTRVATLMLAHDGSGRSFPEIEVGDGHHDLSHHKKNADRLEKIAKIDRFYSEQFAHFLSTMRAIDAGDGTNLLDHTMVCWGSGIADGDRHNHDDLPLILAGGRAAGWNPGRHVQVDNWTPMADLHLDMIRRMGVEAEAFGDSSGAALNV